LDQSENDIPCGLPHPCADRSAIGISCGSPRKLGPQARTRPYRVPLFLTANAPSGASQPTESPGKKRRGFFAAADRAVALIARRRQEQRPRSIQQWSRDGDGLEPPARSLPRAVPQLGGPKLKTARKAAAAALKANANQNVANVIPIIRAV